MRTYHADVERDGQFWLIRAPELDRVTQARHLREVEHMARDLVAIMTDVDPGSFELVVTHQLPNSVQEHLTRARQLGISDRAKSRQRRRRGRRCRNWSTPACRTATSANSSASPTNASRNSLLRRSVGEQT